MAEINKHERRIDRRLSLRSMLRSSRRSITGKSSKPPRVLRLVASASWNALREYLRSKEGMHEVVKYARELDHNGQSILHLACRMHPPLDIVRNLFDLTFPSDMVEMILDNSGQYPLHVASAWGACPQVVDFLLERHPTAASLGDAHGKLPLHLACENCCFEGTCDRGDGQTTRGPMREVITSLYNAAPETINVEDSSGMTPLEYAINYGADLNVVRTLQRASEHAWKKEQGGLLALEALSPFDLRLIEQGKMVSSPPHHDAIQMGMLIMTSPGSPDGERRRSSFFAIPQNERSSIVSGVSSTGAA